MQRFLPWLTTISFIACVVLACLYARELRNIALLRIASMASEAMHRREIAGLKQELSGADAAAKNDGSERQAEKAAATSKPSAIRPSDIAREFPEYAALWQKRVRRMVISQWGDALASLNLPPDRLAQLKNLLVARFTSESDAREAAREAGLQPDTPAYAAAIKQANDAVEQQITALLGPETKAKLDDGQGVTVFKGEVASTYQLDFADAGMPMTPDQSLALAQALRAIRTFPKTPTAVTQAERTPDPATGLSPADDIFLTRAARFLTPAQLEIARNHQIDLHKTETIVAQYMLNHSRDDYSALEY